MNRYLPVLLLLTSLLAWSCGPGRGYVGGKKTTSLSPFISNGYSQVLYKAKLDLNENHFSGMFLFKYNATEQSHHIVFLSEVGLSLLELKYKDNKFELIDCKSFLNKKQVITVLQRDLELLIKRIPEAEYKYYHAADSTTALKCTEGKNKWYYIQNDTEVFELKSRINMLMPVRIQASGYNDGVPQEISIKHKGIKLEIGLTLLNKKG